MLYMILLYTTIVAISGAFSILFAKYDASRIRLKAFESEPRHLNHNFRTWVRVVFCFLIGFLSFGFSLAALIAFMISLSTFYLIFDLWLNEERGKHKFYLGETSKIDKKLIAMFKGNVKKAGQFMFVGELILLLVWSYIFFVIL